ncbi:hypothetical protein GCM10028895_23170 [Pontibacter rugosus]
MKERDEDKVVSMFPEETQHAEKDWQKSIPAQIFLNYFFAINYHIQHEGVSTVDQATLLRDEKPVLTEQDLEDVKRLLINCWSTEYALRSTAELGDEAYMRNALHWTFPQAYYAVFAGMQAFLRTRGISTNNEAMLLREAGRLVVKNAYPKAISFYAAGHYDDFSIRRLPLAHYKPGLQIAGKSWRHRRR